MAYLMLNKINTCTVGVNHSSITSKYAPPHKKKNQQQQTHYIQKDKKKFILPIHVHVNSPQTQYVQKFQISHYLSTPLISEHRLALSIPGNMS